MAKIDLGIHFSYYLDTDRGILIMETRSVKPPMSFEIPCLTIFEYQPIEIKDGDTFEDLKKKKPRKVTIYEQEKS